MRKLPDDHENIFHLAPQQRIAAIRRGIAATELDVLASKMQWPKEHMMQSLGLSRATVSRKARSQLPLSQDESERLLGLGALIGQVDAMLADTGSISNQGGGFDGARWLGRWLAAPLPALAGRLAGRAAASAGRGHAGQLPRHRRRAKTGVAPAVPDPGRGLRVTVALWRIAVEAPGYTAADLGGTGPRVSGGRWNSPGTAVVYCSANIALATLETLGHLRSG